ncbi:MAG: Ppx/GppA family phosphatase [Synergistaceae bacterium]|nr:Ppx/GppA family phosphatase [Synergistaceae bacterium]
MIKAVIDIGSNSIKMRVARIARGKIYVIKDETEVVRLGRGMSITGSLSYESMKISCSTVARMVKAAEKLGANIFIVGTMALRTAKNSDEFITMIKQATGFDVHIFSGEDEAKYSWLGAVDGFGFDGDVIMFDSGGGSTEFVSGSGVGVNKIVSVPIGAVNLSEKFFNVHDTPIKKSSYDEAIEYVKNLFVEYHIDSFATESEIPKIIGVGGGVVTMASVKFACENFIPAKLHGSVLTMRDVTRQIQMYSSLTLAERQNVIGLPASRADVILGSACIVFAALEMFRASSCVVSINGLRHGLLLDEGLGIRD